MQTSVGLFLRGVLMLVCFTSILMAALCGPLLPSALSSILHSRINPLSNNCGSRQLDDSFQPLMPSRTISTRPADPMVPGCQPQPQPRSATWPNEQPKPCDRWAKVAPAAGWSSSPLLEQVVQPEADATVPLPPEWSIGSAHHLGPKYAKPRAAHGVESDASAVWPLWAFEELHTRLQRLGVTYYVLELWEPKQPLYRFCCRVAGPRETAKHFEAVDRDPAGAMRQVLMQVERYR